MSDLRRDGNEKQGKTRKTTTPIDGNENMSINSQLGVVSDPNMRVQEKLQLLEKKIQQLLILTKESLSHSRYRE